MIVQSKANSQKQLDSRWNQTHPNNRPQSESREKPCYSRIPEFRKCRTWVCKSHCLTELFLASSQNYTKLNCSHPCQEKKKQTKKKKLTVKCNPSFTIVAQLRTVFYISRLQDSTRKSMAQTVFLTCCCCWVHRWRCRDETQAIPLTSKQTLKLSEQVFFVSLVPLHLLCLESGHRQ
jgi:hypothetical protein